MVGVCNVERPRMGALGPSPLGKPVGPELSSALVSEVRRSGHSELVLMAPMSPEQREDEIHSDVPVTAPVEVSRRVLEAEFGVRIEGEPMPDGRLRITRWERVDA